MQGYRLTLAMAAAVVALSIPSSATATPVSFTFPAGDAQGWQSCQDFMASCAPGNAATGALIASDGGAETGCPTPPCQFFRWVSGGGLPSLSANYGGAWSFDFAVNMPLTLGRTIDMAIRNASNHALARSGLVPASTTGTISVPLTEPGWLYCPAGCSAATESQFKAVLAEANSLEIVIDLVNGTGENYVLDNVLLTDGPAPAAPPTPPAATGPTGLRAAALKKCAKIKNKKKKKKCKKRARRLPV